MQHFTNISKIFIYSDWEQCNNTRHKQTMNTSNDASCHTETNDERQSHFYTETKLDHIWVMLKDEVWSFITSRDWHIQMKRWKDDSMKDPKPKGQKNFSFQFEKLINGQHFLAVHSILANSTTIIVSHTDCKMISKPHNHSQLYGKQHEEAKLVCF